MCTRLLLTNVVLGLAFIVAPPGSVSAQGTAPGNGSSRTVQEIVSFLVTNEGVQTGAFDQDRAAAEATRDTLTRAMLSWVATVPVSSASSGFVYRFNRELGTPERATATFGPAYVERALTTGAGQASFGVTFQQASFRSLDGTSLNDGTFVTTANQFRDEAVPFDVERLSLGVTARTTTVFATVGITERLEIGGAVPFVRLDVDGRRVNSYRGVDSLRARAEAHSTGLGDVALRSKVRLTPDGAGAAGVLAEVRLPTGRDQDLLGAGRRALRVTGLVSGETGAVSLHGNVAVGVGGTGREFGLGGAIAVAATTRLTLVGEVLTRRLSDLHPVEAVTEPHPRVAGVDTVRLVPTGDPRTAVYAVGGLKWNVGSTWLLQGQLLTSLTDVGLTTRFTPTISLDYAFTR